MFFVGGTGVPGRALSDAPGSRSYGPGRREMTRCMRIAFIGCSQHGDRHRAYRADANSTSLVMSASYDMPSAAAARANSPASSR